jgi:DNA-binding NarL/FixJ family response regulator
MAEADITGPSSLRVAPVCGPSSEDAPPETLLDAVCRAAAGETVLAPPVQRRLVERVRDPEAGALSQREIEVLRQVASGHTNAEIAEQLHISQATVKTHLLHIYDKLGVADRAAAVARSYEKSILSRHGG